MLLTYLGVLKSWLRFPVLIIGSLTVWLFVWLLEATGGRGAVM